MSADTVASAEDTMRFLFSLDNGVDACIERRPSDDLADCFLAKAQQLASRGTRVLVACADDVAARRYRSRLARYPELDASSVATVQEVALRVLADSRVRAVTGRDPRVLDANELDVLMEDMKVSGLKPRRLREMLKFFYKGLSDCANDQDDWLINYEEQRLFAILCENMEVRRALLPCEVSAVACKGLADAGIDPKPLAVLVDDYGTLSVSSQRLLERLATCGLIAAGSRDAAANAAEPYPYAEGFRLFAERKGVARVVLNASAKPASRCTVRLESPVEEFAYVADAVAQCLKDGVDPNDVLVAVPNGTWTAQLAAALKRRGVTVRADGGPAKIKGDPRTLGKFGQMKLAAFLRLHLDSNDAVALRSWLGFGDWLLRSDAFLELMAYARERAISVPQAIEQLRAQADADRASNVFGKFDGPLDELAQLEAALRADLTCDEAAALFDKHGMPLSSKQIALLESDLSHADVDRLARYAFAPSNDALDVPAVVLAPYGRCHGRHVRVTFVTGMVGGFLPSKDAVDDSFTIDHRRNALERDRALFDDISATACDQVICTLFERDLLENTASLNMQVARVSMKDGTRYATVVPSEFA